MNGPIQKVKIVALATSTSVYVIGLLSVNILSSMIGEDKENSTCCTMNGNNLLNFDCKALIDNMIKTKTKDLFVDRAMTS